MVILVANTDSDMANQIQGRSADNFSGASVPDNGEAVPDSSEQIAIQGLSGTQNGDTAFDEELREWMESIDYVYRTGGSERLQQVMSVLGHYATCLLYTSPSPRDRG